MACVLTVGRKGANQWPANCSWGGTDDGGWSQGPSVTGSGWNDPGEYFSLTLLAM